jgi:heterodisulfide reductase subunit B
MVLEKSHRILSSAMRAGAEVMVTSCPLCMHNLRLCYEELRSSLPEKRELSIVYWTQLAAIAFDVETGELPASMDKLLEGLPTSMELVR